MSFVPLPRSFEATAVRPTFHDVPALVAERWSTSSFATTADTSPAELFELGAHLQSCRSSRGRWFPVLSVSDAVGRFLAPRFITTVLVAAFIGMLISLL